jgi:hypothetical protein
LSPLPRLPNFFCLKEQTVPERYLWIFYNKLLLLIITERRQIQNRAVIAGQHLDFRSAEVVCFYLWEKLGATGDMITRRKSSLA